MPCIMPGLCIILHKTNKLHFWKMLFQSQASYYKKTQEVEKIKLSKVFNVSCYQI